MTNNICKQSTRPLKTLFTEALLLYGIYTFISNIFFLIGYYLLPEGIMRNIPQATVFNSVFTNNSFWQEYLLTLLFNLIIMGGVIIFLNLDRIKNIPTSYIFPVSLGIMSGLISGTNSFLASDLSKYSVREGMALGLSIGNIEMIGYILIIVATTGFAINNYTSWWNFSRKNKEKIKNYREIRLSRNEILLLLFGISFILIAAFRETLMSFGNL